MNIRPGLALAVAVAASLPVGCRSTPDSVPITLSSNSGALPVAVEVLSDIQDEDRRVEAMAVITTGLLESGQAADAETVALEAARRVDALPMSVDVVSRQLEIAGLLILLDRADIARRLIVESTTFAAAALDEETIASLLPAIAATAVSGGDETRDLLPAIVDPVYVMQNTALRARTFILITTAYQSVGLRQSSSGLIQQSIPAIRSVPDPSLRAKLLADLSLRAAANDDTRLAESLVEDALEELQKTDGEGGPDTSTVGSVYGAMASLRGVTDAMLAVAALQDPALRVYSHLAIAEAATDDQKALLAVRRAAETVSLVTDPVEYIALHAAVSLAYASLSLDPDAQREALVALDKASEDGDTAQMVETLSAVGCVIVESGDFYEQFLSEIEDPYGKALVSVAVAERLKIQGQPGVADDLLVQALRNADASNFFSDNLRVRIVAAFAKSGSYGLAIGALAQISDPAERARAAALLARHADPAEGLTPIQTEELRRILGR